MMSAEDAVNCVWSSVKSQVSNLHCLNCNSQTWSIMFRNFNEMVMHVLRQMAMYD